MTDDSELNTVVVEFTCPSDQAHEPNSPVDQLIELFRKAKLRFVVEEYRIPREEILTDPGWQEWRESHEGDIPAEVTTFVFLSSEENKPVLGRLFENWTPEKKQQAGEQGG